MVFGIIFLPDGGAVQPGESTAVEYFVFFLCQSRCTCAALCSPLFIGAREGGRERERERQGKGGKEVGRGSESARVS